MEWSWEKVDEVLPLLVKGLQTTVLATLVGSALAIVIGLVFALLMRSERRSIRYPTRSFVDFVRSTPIIVQLFFVYYVALTNLGLNFSAFSVGAAVLGVHYGTYMSEVYRAGIEGVPKGQWEAATALSLPRRQTWTNVVLPQAIPKVLPALGNYVVSMFKETPQLIAIAVPEMMFAAQGFAGQRFAELEAYTMVAVLFLVVSLPAALLVRLLERHYERAV